MKRVERNDETDAALMKRVVAQETPALGELYRRYGQGVGRSVRRWFPFLSAADAADLVQEVFLDVASSAHRYRETDRFLAWLYTIAYRKASDLYRRRNRQESALRADRRDAQTDGRHVMTLSQETRQDLHRGIRQMLDTLPDELREVLCLKGIEGFSAAEIGRITGVEETTVRTRLHRARRLILDHIDADQWRQLLEGGLS